MTLRTFGGSNPPTLGGAGCSLYALDWLIASGLLQPGNNTSWVGGGLLRYGNLGTLPGGTALFDNGSAGVTPNRGFVNQNGIAFRRARNTAAGTAPIDWVSNINVSIDVVQPVANYADPGGVWEVSALLALDSVPTSAITRDCGLVFILSANTAFTNTLRAGVAAGNDFAGFGVVYNGTNGELLWISKKNGAGGGAVLTESVSLGIFGILPTHVSVRFIGARVGAEARLEVYINGVLRLSRLWGAGTVLPIAADATFQAVLGFYKPMIRAGQDSANTAALLFSQFVLKAAETVALLA